MSASLTIITCGPNVAAIGGSPSITSLDAASTDDLNTAIRDSGSDLVAFGAYALEDGEVANLTAAFANDAQLAGVFVGESSGGLDEFPAWMQLFLPLGISPVLVLVRASEGEFSDVDRPLLEWFVRALNSGRHVEIRQRNVSGERALETGPLPELRPTEPDRPLWWLTEAVDRLDLDALFPGGVVSQPDAVALKAGLLQVNDFLGASHEFSQSVQGEGINAAGDYWHAIMHRREPDYSNAKYWFRRVGAHSVFPRIAKHAALLLESRPGMGSEWRDRLIGNGGWDPFAFIDLCASCPRAETDELSLFAREMQWLEMRLLLAQTYRDVIGERV